MDGAPGRNAVSRPSIEARRLAAVHRYQILDAPPDGTFDKVAFLAARIFSVPFAAVAIYDPDPCAAPADLDGVLKGEYQGDDGQAAHLATTTWQDADSLLSGVHKLLTDLGAGVHDDTALLALSVPVHRTDPVQETW
ncbi:hypothetical protein [Streptomyces sp. NBC_00690]|uniref:hypothetical protein n=1 Tax=Streptomyces sp. NBC_00690 TaxID=2975808 RepID=UPI002E2C9DD7|nr:hypothetical protein [Streptomyces sp. NBC_00690]